MSEATQVSIGQEIRRDERCRPAGEPRLEEGDAGLVYRGVIERFAVRWDEVAKDCDKSAAALRKSPKAEVSLRDKLIFALDLLGVDRLV